ncbi:MAG: MFS transporter [Isosphaeraceae bacterium]|nr:MFS transporter [Isosphaeraceae bacterium]
MHTEQAARRGLRALPRNVWVVTITSFLTDVSSEMLTTLRPLFLSNVLGAGTEIVGLVEGVAETTASVLKVLSGWLSDRFGTRKWLAVLGYAISTASKPFLLLATSWVWVLGVSFGDRVGKGIRTAPRDALVADSTPAAERGLAFGVHRAGDTAGAVVGLLVALTVIWLTEPTAHKLSRQAFLTLVLLSVLPAVLAVVCLAVGAKETKLTAKPRELPRLGLRGLDRRFRGFLLIVLVFALGNSSDAFLVLRAQSSGLSLLGVVGMMVCFNVVYTCVSGPAGALSDLVGRRRLIVGGWVVYALIYLGFARVSAGWHAWGLMTLYGIYYGMTEGVAKAYVADLVPPDRRGAAYGVFNAAIGLAALPASLIAGALWAQFGPAAPFYFGAAMAVLASGLLVTVMRGPSEGTLGPREKSNGGNE